MADEKKATWIEIDKAYVGKPFTQTSARTGGEYQRVAIAVPGGTLVNGRDMTGAQFYTFANNVHTSKDEEWMAIIPINEDTVDLYVPVRDNDGRVVEDENGKWVRDVVEVKATALRDAVSKSKKVTFDLNKAFVGEPVERTSAKGNTYKTCRVNLPPDTEIGSLPVGNASFFVFDNQVSIAGNDSWRTIKLPAAAEITLSVPHTLEDGSRTYEEMEVKPADIKRGLDEARERYKAAHQEQGGQKAAVDFDLNKAFVGEPVEHTSAKGNTYKTCRVSLPADTEIGGVSVGNASFFVFDNQVSIAGNDSWRTIKLPAEADITLSVPHTLEDGSRTYEEMEVKPADIKRGLDEARERYKATHQEQKSPAPAPAVKSPAEVRAQTAMVLEEEIADHDISFPEVSVDFTHGR